MNKPNVTIYEIAKECGVSPSTVSRVLNKSPHVSFKTRERVLGVIEARNFSPNAIARAMSMQSSKSIGVVLPDITNPYFSALFLEIQRYTLAHGYSVLLYNTLYGGSSHEIGNPFGELQYFEMLKEKRVDGAIVVGGQMDLDQPSREYVKALNGLNHSIPVVAIGQKMESCECLFISRNLGGGMASLVQHLVALGNRYIGFVGGQVGVRQTTERLKAYRNSLRILDLPDRKELVALSNYYTLDGYNAMKQLLQTSPKLHAVVAINDQVAIGAIRAIRDAQLSVPDDIAVVSCDAFPGGEFQVPRLTTLNQQNEYIGKISILSLISAIQGVKEAIDINHSPQLVVRESCGSYLGIRQRS